LDSDLTVGTLVRQIKHALLMDLSKDEQKEHLQEAFCVIKAEDKLEGLEIV
jgi:hypothetical protein